MTQRHRWLHGIVRALGDGVKRIEFRRHFRAFRELNLVYQETWFQRLSVSPKDFMFMIERNEDRLPLGVCDLVYTS